jgi:hypothetical protein
MPLPCFDQREATMNWKKDFSEFKERSGLARPVQVFLEILAGMISEFPDEVVIMILIGFTDDL